MSELVKCIQCDKEKPQSSFYKCKRSNTGYKKHCKTCHLVRQKKYQIQGNKEVKSNEIGNIKAEIRELTIKDQKRLDFLLNRIGSMIMTHGRNEIFDRILNECYAKLDPSLAQGNP